MGVCGSCGMMVNGQPTLTCGSFLSEFYPGRIRVEPLDHFPVVRDLVVDVQPFVDKLREGYDLVMGNRFKGGIRPGAMPFLHRYLGNPVLTGIGRLFFSTMKELNVAATTIGARRVRDVFIGLAGSQRVPQLAPRAARRIERATRSLI